MTVIYDNKPEKQGDQPEYRIALSIYDNKTGETVCKSSTFLGDESGAQELASLMQHFERKAREEFEAVHYPKESDNN